VPDNEISPTARAVPVDLQSLTHTPDRPAVAAPPAVALGDEVRRPRHHGVQSRHTRVSGAWAAVFAGVFLGVALIDFIVENTRSVRIDFFSAGGRMPVAVALLAAALAGAAVVLAIGVCRTAQLRLVIRRHRRQSSTEQATSAPASAADGVPR
jgi:uncharacterized integral membrane protein